MQSLTTPLNAAILHKKLCNCNTTTTTNSNNKLKHEKVLVGVHVTSTYVGNEKYASKYFQSCSLTCPGHAGAFMLMLIYTYCCIKVIFSQWRCFSHLSFLISCFVFLPTKSFIAEKIRFVSIIITHNSHF